MSTNITQNNASEAQINANRLNALHSTGPKTDEGKARSAMNALKHGFNSSRVVLSNESQDRYDNLLAKYIAAFRPAGQPEYDLVVRMTNAAWRLRRAWQMETAIIDAEYAVIRNTLEASFDYVSPAHRAAEATMSLAIGNHIGLATLRRHETHLETTWHRALNSLIKLQTLRFGRKPVYEFTPDSIEPDETQSNFEEPETFSFSLNFTRPASPASPDRRPWIVPTPPQNKPDAGPKAA